MKRRPTDLNFSHTIRLLRSHGLEAATIAAGALPANAFVRRVQQLLAEFMPVGMDVTPNGPNRQRSDKTCSQPRPLPLFFKPEVAPSSAPGHASTIADTSRSPFMASRAELQRCGLKPVVGESVTQVARYGLRAVQDLAA